MKTRFKTLTVEPEYNILKNMNFRNNQNYISTNKDLLWFSKSFGSAEKDITYKIYAFYTFFVLFIVSLPVLFDKYYSLIEYISLFIILLWWFKILTKYKQYLIKNKRKKMFTLVKISFNKNYYMILYKMWWNIDKYFYY